MSADDAARPGEPVLWAKLRWPQLEELATQPPHMVIWPLGTTEQHGRHMPTDVDIRNCWEVAEGVSARTGIPLLPGLPFGDSRYWEGWPGTLTLQPDTVIAVLSEVIAGVVETGFRRVLLLNGHIGNGPVLALAESRIRELFPQIQVRVLSWWDVSQRVIDEMYEDSIFAALRSFHANRGETSAYLAHSPELIDMSEAVDEPVDEPGDDYTRPFFSYHSRKLTRSGTVGHPSDASAEHGRKVFEMAIEDLVELIQSEMNSEIPADVWQVRGSGS
jgi:creatinine amidohydrolase